MVGFTTAIEKLGPEKSVPFIRILHELLSRTVLEQDGEVCGFAGDSIMAVFGYPVAREDDAIRACRAALSIHKKIAEVTDQIEAQFGVRPTMRVGVSSGLAMMASVSGEGAAPTPVGDAVNLASRIQSLAAEGTCLICDATKRLVEWMVDFRFDGEHLIKGKAKPQKVWCLLKVRDGASRFDASLGRGLTRHIGRQLELATMRDAYLRATEKLRVLDLVAEPGLGKTRLMFELLQGVSAEQALVLQGRCLPEGQQVPFFPFLDVIRRVFDVRGEDEPDVVATKLGAGLGRLGKESPENLDLLLNLLGLLPKTGALSGLDGVLIGLRTRELLPDLLTALCRVSKVVVLLDDLHWIDSVSEELLQKLIENDRQPNLLIVLARRPEYSPKWGSPSALTTIRLQPLEDVDIRYLAQTRLGVPTLPDHLIRQLTERACGNPLFGEEVLNFLIERGALSLVNGEAVYDQAAAETSLPTSLQSLLTARIDRLPQEDRALLQVAAAIGRSFDPGLLAEVGGGLDHTDAALQRLEGLDLVQRETGSSSYIFKHVLLKDSLYQSLLSQRRAELHEAIAKALERRHEGRLLSVADSLAHHYALTDCGALAFTYLVMAGVKSVSVFSLDEADRYFSAALLIYEKDPTCASDEDVAKLAANYGRCCNMSMRVTSTIALANKLRPILNRLGDHIYHVFFLHHSASSLVWNGRYLDAVKVQQDLLDMAKRLGDPKSLAYALVSDLSVSSYGAPKSLEDYRRLRDEAQAALVHVDDPNLTNFFFSFIAWDELCRGRVAEARMAADQAIDFGLLNNDPRSIGYGTGVKALIAMISDDFQEALDLADRAHSLSQADFEKAMATTSRIAAQIALNRPGAAADAERWLTSCERDGWTVMAMSAEAWLAVDLAVNGRIGEGIQSLETVIKSREREGNFAAADWSRLYLCEVYLAILSGEGETALGVLVRNIGALVGVLLFGGRRILSLVEKVRSNPQFHPDGHFIGRTEMILGLLYKAQKKNGLAAKHLSQARLIVQSAGSSSLLTRIEKALVELTGLAASR
jgi:class 3 adenylate cyclase/tetratricopeptide (TPR) repeat protein